MPISDSLLPLEKIAGRDGKTPLALRVTPKTLDAFIGQRHILGPGKLLRRMIEADRLSSILLFGPPGTGKTSLARIIATTTKIGFFKLNAVTSGVADIKRVVQETTNVFLNPSGRSVLFIDEIHRFNKAQQDALLPQVEDGTLILIGATTENPFFEVNKALISRSTVFQLEALSVDDVRTILQNAIANREDGLGDLSLDLTEEALTFLATMAGGDARRALNALELAVLTTQADDEGRLHIGLDVAQDSLQKKSPAYDKSGESHYDTISAFIKSMRGSDPDATVYYLARLLDGGEDVEFIARRIVIAAAEEVGLANPQMLPVAMAAYDGVRRIGLPEGRILLAEAALAVATSPKSNASYMALEKAWADVAHKPAAPIPLFLRNAPAAGMKALGYAQGYVYAHDLPQAFWDVSHLPEAMQGTTYYSPSDRGYEERIRRWYASLRGEEKAEKD